MITKYNDFILDNEFNNIISEIFTIVESGGKWIDDNTVVWELDGGEGNKGVKKLKSFLQGLSKSKIREYFFKFLSKVKLIKNRRVKKNILAAYSFTFLSFLSIDNIKSYELIDNFREEIEIIDEIMDKFDRKSDFTEAQSGVKIIEAGYSSDKGDRGNYVKVRNKKIFIGTNHGVSAPVLMEFLGRVPTKEEMMKLSYEQAIEIFKNKYWDKQNIENFRDQNIANIIYDGCINQGISAMKSILRVVFNKNGVTISDSQNPFDPDFIDQINKLDQESLFNDIKSGRESRYKSSITFKKHGRGWLDRLSKIEYTN